MNTHLTPINVDKQPAVNKIENEIKVNNKSALNFWCRTLVVVGVVVSKLVGNEKTRRADADTIYMMCVREGKNKNKFLIKNKNNLTPVTPFGIFSS